MNAATDAGRGAEAGALAHKHHRKILIVNFDGIATAVHSKVDDTLNFRLDFSPENLPVNKQLPPFEFYRDGKIVKTYTIAGNNDLEFLKQAEAEGYFAMTCFEKPLALQTLSSVILLHNAGEVVCDGCVTVVIGGPSGREPQA